MGDLGEGVGKGIGGLGGRALAVTAALVVASVTLLAASPVLAAEAEEDAEQVALESLKGDKYRMANAKMADRVVRISDALGDQALTSGTPAPEAPAWTDIEAVYVAPTKMPAKLLTKMGSDFPPGVSRAFYGNEADWATDDRAIFVAVKMGKKLASDNGGQQVEVGVSGDVATPLQAGGPTDSRAGVERFSLSGVFSNGAWATATTDVSGREPGESIEFYNTESGVFGFYDPRRSTWYLVVPRPADADSIVVTVRSSTEEDDIVDRLEVPGGGHFIDLKNATGGWAKKAGLPPLACRSLETFSADSGVELNDPTASLIRYTAGMPADGDFDEIDPLLASAIEVMGTVPVTLQTVGSDAEPLTVDGDLAVSPLGNAVSLTFEAPAGQWMFAPAGEEPLTTPAGEVVFDHRSLTGSAGVRTGPGLDGLVAGDLSCAAEGSEA